MGPMPRLAWRVEQLEQHTRADESRLRPYHPPRYLTSKLLAETNFWPRSTLSPSPPPTTLTASGSTQTGGSHLSTAETSLFSDDGEDVSPYASRSGFVWQPDKSIPGLEGWDGGGGGSGNSFADDLVVIDELPEGDMTEAESEAEPTPRYSSTSASWPARAAREGSASLPSFAGASRAGLLVDITPPPSADSFQSTTPPGPVARPETSMSRSLAGAEGLQHLLGEVEDRTLLRLQHEPTFVSTSTSYRNASTASGGARARIPSGGGVDSVRRLREAFARAQDSPQSTSTGNRTSTLADTSRQPPVQPVWNPYTSPSAPSDGGGASTSRSKAAVQSWLSTSQGSLASPPRPSPPAVSAVERRTIIRHPNELRSARGFPPPEPRQRSISRSPEPFKPATDDQEPLGTDEDSPPTPPIRVPPTFFSRHSQKDASDLLHRSAAFEEEETPSVRIPAGFGLYNESSLLGPLGRHVPDESAAAGTTLEEEPTPAHTYARHRSRTPPTFESPAVTARTARERSPKQASSSLQTFMAFQQAPAQLTSRSISQPQSTPALPSLLPAVPAHSTPPPSETHDASRSQTRLSSTAKGKARAKAFDTLSPVGVGAYADGPSVYTTPGRGCKEDELLAFKPSRQLRRSPSKSLATPGPLPASHYALSPTPAHAAGISRTKASPRTSPLVTHPLAQRASTSSVHSPQMDDSPRRIQPEQLSPRRSFARKSTSFAPPSSTSPSSSAYVSPLRAIVGSPSRERFSPRRMITPPPAAPIFAIESSADEEEENGRVSHLSDSHDAGSERSDASAALDQVTSDLASKKAPIEASQEASLEAALATNEGDSDEAFDSVQLSPPPAAPAPSRSQTPSPVPSVLARQTDVQTPVRRAAFGTLVPPGTIGAPTPRAPGGWGWTPGGADKGKGRASTSVDTEEEVVVLRRRKIESPPLAVPSLSPLPMPTTQQRVVSLPSSVPQSFSPSSARTLLATPARQSPAVRRLSFSLLSARSPGSPATPSRLRLAHLRRQLGKVEAEERAVLDRVREVRREVEEVRWIKARRSQDNPVSTNVKASKWAWSAVIFAFWWIGLSIVHSLQAPSALESPYHPALYAPQVSSDTSPLFALAPTLPLGLSAFELPGKVRAGWLVALGTVLGGGGGSEGIAFWESLVAPGGENVASGVW